MPQVQSEYLKQGRQEVNPVKGLSRPIQTPIEKLEQRHQSVGLVHVVPIFSSLTKRVNHSNDKAQQLP